MSDLIPVWEYSKEGRTLLGEYRELQYAMNRANNRQVEANRQREPIWIDVGNGIFQTYGTFDDTCEQCAGVGLYLHREGQSCPGCNGSGIMTVRTMPLEPTQLQLI